MYTEHINIFFAHEMQNFSGLKYASELEWISYDVRLLSSKSKSLEKDSKMAIPDTIGTFVTFFAEKVP